MIITLEDFQIANGEDRTLIVLGDEAVDMQQSTQTTVLTRDAWQTAFPDFASRSISLSYRVTYPACESLEAALMQSRQVLAQCPKGGILTEQHGAVVVTYSQAWIHGIRSERTGVTNRFTFDLTAVDPDTATPSQLALMDSQYVANFDGLSTGPITALTGGTTSDLDALVTADVAVGFRAYMTVTLGGVAQPRIMRLIEDPNPGVTTTNTDPTAGTIIVLPLDYDAETNPKIWSE